MGGLSSIVKSKNKFGYICEIHTNHQLGHFSVSVAETLFVFNSESGVSQLLDRVHRQGADQGFGYGTSRYISEIKNLDFISHCHYVDIGFL